MQFVDRHVWLGRRRGTAVGMAALVVILIVLIALGILGAVLKGLLWLTLIVAVIAVVATTYGWFKLRGRTGTEI
jgi:hypothetical protein